MKKTAIITDSAGNLTLAQQKDHDIFVVPLRIEHNGNSYRDGEEITSDEIYERVGKADFKTSLPSPDDVLRLYNHLSDAGYTDAVHICVSSSLSGTYNMVSLLAADTVNIKVHPVDSKTISIPQGIMAMECAMCLNDTKNTRLAVSHMMEVRDQMGVYFFVDSLEQLQKSGRIGKVEMLVGTTLNIKPVFTVSEAGKLVVVDKVRGCQRAISVILDRLHKRFPSSQVHTAVAFGAGEQEAIKLNLRGNEVLRAIDSFVTQATPVLGIHTGPSLLGIMAYEGSWLDAREKTLEIPLLKTHTI